MKIFIAYTTQENATTYNKQPVTHIKRATAPVIIVSRQPSIVAETDMVLLSIIYESGRFGHPHS